MFPGSPNINLRLLRLSPSVENLGINKYKLIGFKDVIGINKSVTSKEHYTSKEQNYKVDLAVKVQSFIYDGSKHAVVNNVIYHIERTYINGGFIELYLSESNLGRDDIDDYIE